MTPQTTILYGDAWALAPTLAPASIDCIVTSPPYAQQRHGVYEGIDEKDYPARMVTLLERFVPALKPKASVLINIREHRNPDGMSDYVHRTRLAIREAGWCEVDELIWIKPNGMPTGPNTLPRRAWERILWFSLSPLPYCNPLSDHAPHYRFKLETALRWARRAGYESGGTGSDPVTARYPNWIMCPVWEATGANGHPAVMPSELAAWLIGLVCPEGGTVLDPFAGSGTTLYVARKLGRDSIGFELNEEYGALIHDRLKQQVLC